MTRRLLLLALMALFVGCRGDSEAVTTYKKFALLYFDSKMGNAIGMATGKAAQRLTNMVNPPPGQPYVRPPKETVGNVHDIKFIVESEEASGDTVVLRVRVDAKIDRPGVHSVGGTSRAVFMHDVTMTHDAGVWKVSVFEDKEVPAE